MVMVRKLAAYVMLGINSEGFKEIISLSIGENESVNNTCKKLNRQRSVFPSSTALLKALYLSTLQITKKWRQVLKNWGGIYGEFSIIYEGRMPE